MRINKATNPYLVFTDISRGLPVIQVAVPKIKLQPIWTSTEMDRVARTRHGAVGRRGSRTSVVGDISHIAAP
jgi:hypothetical protein